jgi:hypothetical protein
VGVEPTTRLAKSRITGFEDREDHRTLFASVGCKTFRVRSLVNVRNLRDFRNWVWCCWGAIRDSGNCLVQIGDREVRVPFGHRESFVSEQFRNISEWHSRLAQAAGKRLSAVMPAEMFDARRTQGRHEPVRVVAE